MLRVFLPALLFVSMAQAGPFRLHLFGEPSNLDPSLQKSSASSYLWQNLYRNLYLYDNDKGLVPDLGTGCSREKKNPQILVCGLKKNLKWSDGTPLTAEDFLRSYRRLLDPAFKAPRADLLFAVRNAKAVYAGEKKELGVRAVDAHTLRFELEEKAPDFEYNLTSTVLTPVKGAAPKPEDLITNGPYKVKSWIGGKKVVLAPNAHYPGGDPARPEVEMLFIDEDSTALNLFEKKELDFLRRLPTVHIAKYREKPEFHWIPLTRLDYIGFGPAIRDRANVREALALSLDYDKLQALFQSRGRPGCPGVPESWFADGKPPCLPFDPEAAKRALGKEKLPTLQFLFSALGGDDHKRAAEFEQDQWKKHLGVDVRIKAVENKLFLAEMQRQPPGLFRKGIAADRPTCLALLEHFLPDHPENYLKFTDAEFLTDIETLRSSADEKVRRQSCEKALRRMVETRALIPLGRIEFAVLAATGFTGWRLNEMNQMDLANLKPTQ